MNHTIQIIFIKKLLYSVHNPILLCIHPKSHHHEFECIKPFNYLHMPMKKNISDF